MNSPTPSQGTLGGLVLCGGRSSRMGRPKALLPFGPECVLQRVVRVLRSVVAPVAVVAAAGQPLPDLPDEVLIVRDRHEALGPLAGLASGLRALSPTVTAAYATACDTPLLLPAFIQKLASSQGEYELAVACEDGFCHPLAAVYSTALADRMDALIQAGQYRPLTLIQQSRSRLVTTAELRAVDPDLDSLRNMNTPEEYQAVLQRAGFAPGPAPGTIP